MFTLSEVAAVAAQPMGFGGPHDGNIDDDEYRSRLAVLREKE